MKTVSPLTETQKVLLGHLAAFRADLGQHMTEDEQHTVANVEDCVRNGVVMPHYLQREFSAIPARIRAELGDRQATAEA